MKIAIAFLCGLVLVGWLFINLTKHNEVWKSSELQLTNYDADLLEYHTTAVNCATGKGFPKFGFALPFKNYRFAFLNRNHQPVDTNFIASFFVKTGVATFIRKPPVYALILAGLYKLLGVDVRAVFIFQLILLLATVLLLVLLGYEFTGFYGGAIGLIAGLITLQLKLPMALQIDPEILLSFFLVSIFVLDVRLCKKENTSGRFLQGIIFCMAILTRGTVIPVMLLYVAYLFFSALYQKKIPIAGLFLLAGVFVLLLPWIVFANSFNGAMMDERMVWSQKNKSLIPNFQILQNTYTADRQMTDKVIDYIYRKEYATYAASKSFIIVTPQAEGDQILSMHNEFCAQGGFHFEWILIKNSFYNTHPSTANPLVRISELYQNIPFLFFKIMKARLSASTLKGWRWIALLFLITGCLHRSTQRLKKFKHQNFALISISIFCLTVISVLVFPGEPLFIALIDGLFIFYACLSALLLIRPIATFISIFNFRKNLT